MKILLPLSWLYGAVMSFRNWLFDHGHLKQESFDLPIISVGNLAVGGTGKTPHSEYLLRLLTREGWKCAMLSRGYGRKTKGYYEAKGNQPSEVGDEPWQVQKNFPDVRVCVCEKRVVGIQKMLEKNRPDVIVLDDAYQHRYVKPGLSVLLTDYSRTYDSDDVLPAGRLREFRSGAKRADVILVTKCPKDLSEAEQRTITKRLKPLSHQSVFFTAFDYGNIYPFGTPKNAAGTEKTHIESANILLLCGIAQPKSLIDYLRPRCKALTLASFPDHHNFTTNEIQKLGQQAANYDFIVTTEKDAARLSGYDLPATLKEKLLVQPIEVKFIDKKSEKFNLIIKNYVTENSRNRSVD